MNNHHLLIWLLLLAIPSIGYSQSTNFEDGFEDGDFTNNPTWAGDDTLYTIISDGTNNLLRLQGNDEDGGVDYLSVASEDSIGSWEFYVQLDFSPSGGNKADIFLMSNIANLEGPVNGYALRAGESGSNDVFRIVRYDSGAEGTTVLSGTTDISSGGTFRVKVGRESGGIWTLQVAEGYSGILTQEGSSQADDTYNTTNYFGVRSTYTSSRADLFHYDFKIDLPPLMMTDATARGDTIEVTFNRPFDQSSIQSADFFVNQGIGAPSNVITSSPSSAKLFFATPFSSNQYELSAQNIQDLQGNMIVEDATASFVVFGSPAEKDIILNEFMYDPPTGQPEYVELRNTSDKYLNLQHWQIGDDSNNQELSSDTLAIAPDDFLVISSDTTTLSTIFGDHNYLQANLPSLNNIGDALKLLTNSGIPADSLYYQSSWGGDQVALERRSDSVSAIYQENWANSPSLNNGTPGTENQVASDTQPPDLRSLNILSDSKLQLLFNERLDSSSAAPIHYTIPGIDINSATLTAPDTIHLALNTALENAREYQLTISGVQDIFGNTSTSRDTSFTYYKISAVDSTDIFINEFMFDPPSGQSEYVELYNPSSKTLDLQDWTLNDATGSEAIISYQQYLLPPDSLVVLAPDSTLLVDHPGASLIEMGNRFPSLNNSGDRIVLRDSSRVLLDSLQYADHWGGEQIALERRSQTVAARYSANWGDAPNGFGTPGQLNQIEDDQTPPAIDELTIIDNNSLQLIISEHPDISSAESINSYAISGNPTIGAAHVRQPDTVSISLSDSLLNNTTYTFSLDGLEDVFGNTATDVDTTFTYYEVSPADSGQVFISEFLFDPEEGKSEYIELYNPTQRSFDLQHWTVNDNTGTTRTITDERYILPPDGYIVLAADRSLSTQYSDISLISMGTQFPSLNNSGDDIVLRDSSGILLDSLQYASSWSVSEKASERKSYKLPSIYKANWASPVDSSGSPGMANTVAPDTQPPSVTSFSILDEHSLQIIFDEYLSSPSTNGLFSISGDIQIGNTQFQAPDTVLLSLSQPLENAELYTLTISDVQDLFGNAMAQRDTSFTYYKPTPVDSGQVFINEFRAEPYPGSTEYIELYNPTSYSFDLQHWTINDNRRNPASITNSSFILPPQSFVLIAPDNTLLTEHPSIKLVAMDQFPSLNNSGDDIVLRNINGMLLDSLQYNAEWRTDSTAFERRSTSVSGFYKENWGHSLSPAGGTPGTFNQVEMDTNPPILNNLEIISKQQLQLAFNERLDSTGSQRDHFGSNNLDISSVSHTAPDSITLHLATDLKNAQQYELTLSGLQDIFGNQISPEDTTLTYFAVSTADSGDVFINEFSFNPKEGDTEYIELYNNSSKSFDLQGWTVNDNTGNRSRLSDQKHLLPPDSYILLAEDSTLAKRHPDLPVIPMFSRFPSLNNGGDDIVLRDSSGTLLDSLRYTDTWAMPGKAAERRSHELSANIKANWGSPADTTGSPGLPNLIAPDAQSPVLKTLDILGDQELQLIFDEQIADIAEYGSFKISSSTQISDLTFFAPDTVHLQLSEPLQNATEYQFSISEIQDMFGNKLTAIDTLFTYYKPSESDSGQVFINEFSYNPAAGQTEYIELYNHTNHSFDLQGWTLSDNRDEQNLITDEAFILPPDNYVVLSPDNSLLETAPDLPLIAMGSRFPALNNSGDDIVIRNEEGLPLDSLKYTSAWGGEEIALERLSTNISGTFKENWGPAPGKTGSPGLQNSIKADQQPPSLSDVNIKKESELQLIFSERLTAVSAVKKSNYTLSPVRNIQLIAARSDTVTLYLSDPLISGQHYTLTVSGVTDIFGNQSSENQKDLEYIEIAQAKAGDIIINEMMTNPGLNSAEFVELYNRSGKNIDLDNWAFSDARDEVNLPSGIILKTGEYLILTESATLGQSIDQALTISGFPSLNNTEETLSLYDSNGQLIDSLHYTSDWPEAVSSASLERKDPKAASNDPANWTTNTTEQKNSAGIQNSTYQEDILPPEVRFTKVRADGKIEVYFTEFIQRSQDLQFTMDGQSLEKYSFDPHSGNRIILEEPASLAKAIDIQGLTDIRGNTTPNASILVARPLQKGDLVINEIMYNPLDEGDDNQADQSEYVELYNTRDYALSLEGLILHDAPDEDNDVRKLQPVSTTAKWVKPGQTVLVYADQALDFQKSKVASFFNLDSLNTASLLQIDRSSLSLSSADDAIFIADSSGAVIDSVYYSEEWQNPNLIDYRGRALERISPKGASNTASNWGSSVHPKGGTPHAQNSLYQEQPDTPQKMGITFAPNPFSPDGDGYEDNLVINYKLDKEDYLLRVNIFDRYGRHIKELADGKPAGFEGTLIWDGRRDDGRRNRIGIYIIVFEAINSSTGSDKAYKKTVVIARKLN
ncbi:lamin tail domain-containing protein [Fodinibius salsisoli]|uniref:Lamin tail domain-containing protein n=1 Tax=Fodinibius salsisoli TaxID=2820877 RepID=A0ABT3PJA8_9BACT|nr:lamin tail domain-containing protein [Fodinibius salsisoli]MCW9706026.1 lamin tail domain-containing protein [Fodinibius salsisoli]